jgi:hypothetical protein
MMASTAISRKAIIPRGRQAERNPVGRISRLACCSKILFENF